MIVDDTASRIIAAEIADKSGDAKRHERRLRAMRSLGKAERRFDYVLKITLVFLLACPVLLAALLYWATR